MARAAYPRMDNEAINTLVLENLLALARELRIVIHTVDGDDMCSLHAAKNIYDHLLLHRESSIAACMTTTKPCCVPDDPPTEQTSEHLDGCLDAHGFTAYPGESRHFTCSAPALTSHTALCRAMCSPGVCPVPPLAAMADVLSSEQCPSEDPVDPAAAAAELFLEGFPLELMDGDVGCIPIDWVTDVLKEVRAKFGGDPRVFVLTVLGVQSTGKSTLLNTMFGLQFTVSSGRCTRGAFMQLMSIDDELKQELECDFILVIDTEGLKAPELATHHDSYEHDNELATVVIGLSDVTLINLAMENVEEMKDVLQIVVHAFLRITQVGKKPKCLFVHQNSGDVAASDKNMRDKKCLINQLNAMTVAAAKMEHKESTYSKFTNVMEHDPHIELYKSLAGCEKQCPFCGVPCDRKATLPEQESSLTSSLVISLERHWYSSSLTRAKGSALPTGLFSSGLQEGFPLELMDGDVGCIPIDWVTDVLEEVRAKFGGDPHVFVLTVLGAQSTGQSTLLNTMFGLQFTVSSGRCTRGAFMQLMSIDHELKQELECDFILVIDVEGLKAPELATLHDSYEHDNELATVVIGLSDVTLINLAMENVE
ncbi:unnamed protein product [Lampetra fluviatilis]